MITFFADVTKISFSEILPPLASIDINFAGERVWSIDVRERGATFEIAWPDSLKPYLLGATTVSITDSSTGQTLASDEVRFTDDDVQTRVVDSAGINLSVNKWGRLGRALDAIGSDIQEEILRKSVEIIEALKSLNKRPFIVGGTLLGAVRDGQLLPHDDDADIAYLSEHTSPVDVAIEGFSVGRELEALGYKMMRHSATHMQLHFIHESTNTPYYIDVFGAFFSSDGYINQPFHVRGKMEQSEMLPFAEVEIGGHKLPTPADTNRWLTINYDADWRTPIPGFNLGTPDSTNRRFFNWFGSFNHLRHFWNEFYENNPAGLDVWTAGAEWFSKNANRFTSAYLVELGAGAKPVSFMIVKDKTTAIATDFAATPLKLAELQTGPNSKTAHLNLSRLDTITLPQRLAIDTSFDVIANHLLDQTAPEAREGAYRAFRMALQSGGMAATTFFTRPDANAHPDDPTLWHLEPTIIAAEAEKHHLGVTFTPILSDDPQVANRAPYAAIFDLTEVAKNLPKEQFTLKQRIARFLETFTPGKSQKEIVALKKEVEQLRRELDEYRGLSSRVAQLTDIIASSQETNK